MMPSDCIAFCTNPTSVAMRADAISDRRKAKFIHCGLAIATCGRESHPFSKLTFLAPQHSQLAALRLMHLHLRIVIDSLALTHG